MLTTYPTQLNIFAALRSFLVSVLPSDVVVIAAEVNRVPEPKAKRFVVMTPLRQARLRTNEDSDEDVRFTAAIAGTTMTVSAVSFGAIAVGASVFGTGVAASTRVTALGTGTGGVGTYTISPSQTVASRVMSSGAKSLEQGMEVALQLDFHSDQMDAGDLAMTVSTLMRDDYAVQQFADQDPNYGVVPLFADDPRQAPFINDQQQFEYRWVVEAHLQANEIVSVPQQYADSVEVEVISVDATYPP
jgi:hypothetical protein